MKTSEKILVISKILKRRFTNLTVEETISIAGEIVDSLAVGDAT